MESTMEDRYRETLDECYDPAGLVESYGAARILEEVDPIAYRVGLSEYADRECQEGNHEYAHGYADECEWCGEATPVEDDEA